jgi:cobalt/nickel transport system ATP-binding protein
MIGDRINVLSLKDVSFSYRPGREVLKGVSLSVERGEQVALIGANGVGKSTLLKLFVGLLEPHSGCVEVCGMTVERKNLASVRRAAGYVFQDAESQLFLANVWEDVAFGPRNEGLAEDEVRKRTEVALESVGISSLAQEHVYRLSGGQKRLASIATVLALRPDVLLLDEPTLALDPRNRRMVIRALGDLPCAKLIATHDLDFVLDSCSRVIVISGGRIVAEGAPAVILRNRELLESNGLELPLSQTSRCQ